MDSEKVHEKSRNSLWEAFMTESKDSKSPEKNVPKKKEISPKEDAAKKSKIGVTIKKSPNSDRTFESRLLNQELENMSIKSKHLDICMDSESDSIASDEGSGKKEPPVKKPVFVKRKSNESAQETIKSVAAKNPFSMAQSKRTNTAELNKRKTEGVNLNINKKPNVDNRPLTNISLTPATFTSSSSGSSSTNSSSSSEDSEYEIQEIYQLKEWFPPDLTSKPKKSANSSLTLIQSRSSTGPVREMRIEADPAEFK